MTVKLFEKSPCKLGVNLSSRREKHGTDPVCAKDLRVKGYMLNKANLCRFFDDKHVWDMWFIERGKNNPVEPFLHGRTDDATGIKGKWKDSSVTIEFGLKPYSVTFAGCTISRVDHTRQIGGLVAMDFTISCLKRNITGDLALIDDFLDCQVDALIEFGPEDEDEDDDDKAAKKKTKNAKQGELAMNAEDGGRRPRRKPSEGAVVN